MDLVEQAAEIARDAQRQDLLDRTDKLTPEDVKDNPAAAGMLEVYRKLRFGVSF